MKNKKFNKTKLAVLSAIFISSSVFADLSEPKYMFVLGDKSGNYVVNGVVSTPDPTPPADPNAGSEKLVPVEGYDYPNLDAGTYSSYLRTPDQTTIFGSGETFTYGTGYTVSGSSTGSTENDTLYLNLLGLKTVYNSSSFQLSVSPIDSLNASVTLPAQKSGNNLSAEVQESYAINYNSSSDIINLNGTQANGKKTFNSTVGLYMNYTGDANTGNFTFTSPSVISKATHSVISYTDGENRVDFSANESISFKDGRGFLVSPAGGGGYINTITNTYYNILQNAYEGYYSYDSVNQEITYSDPLSFSSGAYVGMRDNAVDFGLPTVYLKLNPSEYIKIQFNGSSVLTDATDSNYDCIDPTSCTVGGLTITYDSGNNIFNII